MKSAKQVTKNNWNGDLWSEPLAWLLGCYFAPGDSLSDLEESLEDLLENFRELLDAHGYDALVRHFLDKSGDDEDDPT
jgi:hypothetical protein